MLNVVRKRKIHQVWLFPLQYPDARFQNEQRKVGGICAGERLTDIGRAVVDAVVLLRALVGLLGGERNAMLQSIGKHFGQLVLRCNRNNFGPVL